MTRLTLRSPGWFASPPPSVGVAVTPQRVSAVAIACRDGVVNVVAHASAALPPGTLAPALTGRNVLLPEFLDAAVAQVLARMPSRPRRVALALPDAVAKVSLMRLDKLPERAADLDQLVRWQVGKAAPFPLDQAQVAYTSGAATSEGGQEFLVAVARRDVVAEYEGACARAGAHAGAVDIAALGLIETALVGDRVAGGVPPGDWLLVHLDVGWCTLAIVRGDAVIFFRSRGLEGEEQLPNLVHQTAMYYEDRLGGQGFSRVLVADSTSTLDNDALRDLESRLRTVAAPLDPRTAAALLDRTGAGADVVAGLAAPLGLALREWVA